jgi:hypothetical protein
MLRYSPDDRYLAIQRSSSTIEVVDLEKMREMELTIKIPPKENQILNYYWAGSQAICVVTRSGLELHRVDPVRMNVKLAKSINVGVMWYLYQHDKGVAVLATIGSTSLQGYQISAQALTILKLPRIDVDVEPAVAAAAAKSGNPPLRKEEVLLARVYDRTYLIHLHVEARELVLYQLGVEQVLKTHRITFITPKNEKFALSVVDNVIVVHNLSSKVAKLYDIKTSTKQSIANPLPLSLAAGAPFPAEVADSLYADSWRFYPPNIVVDVKAGYVWDLHLSVSEVASAIADKTTLLEFLLRRQDAREIILRTLRNMVVERESLVVIAKIVDLLNSICSVAASERQLMLPGQRPPSQQQQQQSGGQDAASLYVTTGLASPSRHNSAGAGGGNEDGDPSAARKKPVEHLIKRRKSSDDDGEGEGEADEAAEAAPSSGGDSSKPAPLTPQRPVTERGRSATVGKYNSEGYAIIDQVDIHQYVLTPVEESKRLDSKYLVALVMEYIRSLNYYGLPVDHALYQFIINLLVKHGRFYQLHQFLQYHVVADSVHAACQLLSLEQSYAPAYQLALDMLNRLGAYSDIVEVLLARGSLLDALRYSRARNVRHLPPARFLQMALEKGDRLTYFSVYDTLRTESLAANRGPGTLYHKDSGCDEYINKFKEWFGQA